MEIGTFNRLMAHRQENFFLPVELAAEVDPLVERYGKKRKWAVYAAALVALLQRSRPEQDDLVRGVAGARSVPGGFDPLLRETHRIRALADEPPIEGAESIPLREGVLPPQNKRGKPPAQSRGRGAKGKGRGPAK